jgi:hypothetical protein
MNLKFVIVLLTAALLYSSCSPGTRIVQSWKDPAVTVTEGSYNRILVISLIKDNATRRIAEDHMASFIGKKAVTSYSYLGPDQAVINEAGMDERMQKDGIDGVLIMRLVDQSTESTYVPGSTVVGYNANPWGYYGYSYGYYSTPGYYHTDRVYTVETNLYNTKRDGVLWTGTTSTLNPVDIGPAIEEIMSVIYKQMKREGFIVPPTE